MSTRLADPGRGADASTAPAAAIPQEREEEKWAWRVLSGALP